MKSSGVVIVLGLTLFTALSLSFKKSDPQKSAIITLKDSSNNYLDGTYEGHSRASYTSEPFWGQVNITVENSSFADVRFKIRDSTSHEDVDSMYGVIHYAGNPEYMQQCVNEQHGIEAYPGYLLASQDLDNVDAYTGASAVWSHDIFIASAKDALKNAQIPNSIENGMQANNIDVFVRPNPFSSTVYLKYNLTEKSIVSLSIYNSEGRLIKQLVNQEQQAGYYNYRWDDCSNAGIYYYRLSANDVIFSSKVVKL